MTAIWRLLAVLVLVLVSSACHGSLRNLPTQGGSDAVGSRIEPRLSRAGKLLAGASVGVRCCSRADWLTLIEDAGANEEPELAGYTSESTIHLPPVTCRPLTKLAYKGRSAADAGSLVYALGVFAHELEHARGTLDEAETECHGLQRIAATARALGAPRQASREFARAYWRDEYPFNDEEYRSPECRNRGELDLRPRNDLWP